MGPNDLFIPRSPSHQPQSEEAHPRFCDKEFRAARDIWARHGCISACNTRCSRSCSIPLRGMDIEHRSDRRPIWGLQIYTLLLPWQCHSTNFAVALLNTAARSSHVVLNRIILGTVRLQLSHLVIRNDLPQSDIFIVPSLDQKHKLTLIMR